jgi:hypothetical protein
MWKKRLIALVTFLAGLYYFLEFVVPPTIPWATVRGVVVAPPTKEQLLVKPFVGKQSIRVGSTEKITREMPDGSVSVISVSSVKIGDRIKWHGKEGKVLSIPAQGQFVIETYGKPRTVKLTGKSIIFRKSVSGSDESVTWDYIKQGNEVKVGPTTYLSQWQTNVNDFFVVLGSLAWGMGLFSLWLVHSTAIRKRRGEWGLSVVFFVFVVFGVIAGYGFGNEKVTWAKNLNDLAFDYMLVPMGSTIFSLLAFYMASAAYRSFKAKTGEAVMMMVSAMIVMLGQIPMGLWITKWLPQQAQLPVVSQWILYVINSAAVKGMWFGMMLGAIAVGLRFWLSLERGAYFDMEL